MLLLYMLVIWEIQAKVEYQLNMFNMNGFRDRYCLFYYESDDEYSPVDTKAGVFSRSHHLTSYCLRPSKEEDDNNNITDVDNSTNTNSDKYTFIDLKQRNVTSAMLLSWDASLDIAEQYQIFLNNDSKSMSTANDFIFYNCTSPWFGPLCQFAPIDRKLSYSNILLLHAFERKEPIRNGMQVTCYEHIVCQTYLSCLDWREICDGKNDCIDGLDEKDCWQLEVSQCNTNEYRCTNGQCIPKEFVHDHLYRPDCIDRTDEPFLRNSFDECNRLPSFSCEETTCHTDYQNFPCGNGECTDGIRPCYNGRSMKLFDDFCSYAASCIYPELRTEIDDYWCVRFCNYGDCLENNCSNIFEYRLIVPILGHVRLMLSGNETNLIQHFQPSYVCFDETLCQNIFSSTIIINGFTCVLFNELMSDNIIEKFYLTDTVLNIKKRFRVCSSTSEIFHCNYSSMYQCQNSSKCISKQRLLDGFLDCPFNDDETFDQSCTLPDVHQRFRCKDEAGDRCFTYTVVHNNQNDCKYREDELYYETISLQSHIYFSTICDGIHDLIPIFLDIENETDETNCQHWPCNNLYTRCDGFWSCKNGLDEIDCETSICPHNQHKCIFPNDTSKLSCLSIENAGDDIADCLGETDERIKYRLTTPDFIVPLFKCWNDSKSIELADVCNNQTDCKFNDDESFCQNFGTKRTTLCKKAMNLTDVENFLCAFSRLTTRFWKAHFQLKDITNYPLHITFNEQSSTSTPVVQSNPMIQHLTNDLLTDDTWYCNQGIPIHFQKNQSDILQILCLCPPSYYGNQCQYQNQRVSLTVQIRVPSDPRTPFVFLVTLVDNDRNIHSYDYIEYISIRDCMDKFNIYLVYATRPKDLSKVYSIQIDALNHKTMKYRASWIFPVRHSFIPVYRLAVLLRFPFTDTISEACSSLCIHGKCFRYINDPKSIFCHCESGWSGIQCNIQHDNECAPGSFSVNRSICLCSLGRFGSRCQLSQSTCNPDSCLNRGECVPNDERYTVAKDIEPTCICSDNYSGKQCRDQQILTHIEITFDRKIKIPSMLFIHLISIITTNTLLAKTTIAKKIQFDQDSLTVFTSISFNIAFVQTPNDYYLIIIRNRSISSSLITSKVVPSHRCQSINELFDDTFANQHLLKRIKYYHLPCQQRHDLVCFYDDVHMCLCTVYHEANCFEFNHSMIYNCEGYNHCENNGHCFQDDAVCPKTLFCACELCSFGSKCQVSTKGSTLFLDIILGYHIRPNTSIHQQPLIVKLSIVLTVLILVFGLLNCFLMFQTFRVKTLQSVGCGVYLYASSFVSFITLLMLVLKFSFFLSSQIGLISNRSFLYVHCLLMDYCIRILLTINNWLSACVAIERAVNILQGVNFQKTNSKRIAKWIIVIVVSIVSCSYLYDPIHHRLIDDEEEKRTWCITQYSSIVQMFDWILNIVHFLVPFIINLTSAVIVIIIAARTRSNIHENKSFKEHLRDQLRYHKHLFISPIVIIILALPSLIISFLSGCMKSSRESWFYVFGYFISFIPSIMTFIVFVLPSDIYKKEFSKSMKEFWSR